MIDGGAGCSAISRAFVDTNGIKTTLIPNPLVAKGYDGKGSPCTQYVSKARLRLKELKDEVDLLVLELDNECDVILGKAWLDKHNPMVDWPNNILTFHKPNRTVILSPIRLVEKSATPVLISNLQLKRAVNKRSGSPVFVAVITNEPPATKLQQEITKQDVPIPIRALLDEFADVFPDDLPVGMPPPHQIQMKIDVPSNTSPVHKPLYRLAQSELDELKR